MDCAPGRAQENRFPSEGRMKTFSRKQRATILLCGMIAGFLMLMSPPRLAAQGQYPCSNDNCGACALWYCATDPAYCSPDFSSICHSYCGSCYAWPDPCWELQPENPACPDNERWVDQCFCS